jgi:hypothetical protein
MKVLRMRANEAPPERERVDRVAVIVVSVFLAFCVIRGVIPALIAGEQIGMVLLATGLALLALALALLPARRRRRGRGELGRSGSTSE